MEFTNEFSVPTDVDTTFATLTDLEKVAPCLPGAQLEEVDGEVHRGRVKVKVGPISLTYRGEARLAEVDEAAKSARIEAKGKEARGTGTASADVSASLREEGGQTVVTVVTDLNVTGKPAQFGRGVMAEVGTKIIDTFADRLRAMLDEGERGSTPTGAETAPARGEAAATGAAAAGAAAAGDAPANGDAAGPQPPATGGPRQIAPDPAREHDALDLMDVAGGATAKRLVPLVAVAVLAVVGWLVWRRRS